MTTGPAFTIEAAAFRGLLSAVAPAVKAKSPLAVLGGVHLTATAGYGDGTQEAPGTLRAWATDLTMGVVATAPAVVAAPGDLVVAHDLLAGLAARLAGPVACAPAPLALAVAAGPVTARVRTCGDPQDMPVIPAAGTPAITVDAAALAAALARVVHATGDDWRRPALAGVHVDPCGGALRLEAADGYRLATTPVEGAVVAPDTPPLIVPAKAMRELARLLKGTAAPVELRIASRGAGSQGVPDALAVVAPAWTLVARLIDGGFPATAHLIPATTATTATVDAEDLRRAVQTARPFGHVDPGDRKHQAVRLSLADGAVRVGGADADRGESEVAVAASLTGPGVEVNLDAGYVLDALEAAGEGAVAFGVDDPRQPVVFRQDAAAWVVMPMVKGGA